MTTADVLREARKPDAAEDRVARIEGPIATLTAKGGAAPMD